MKSFCSEVLKNSGMEHLTLVLIEKLEYYVTQKIFD